MTGRLPDKSGRQKCPKDMMRAKRPFWHCTIYSLHRVKTDRSTNSADILFGWWHPLQNEQHILSSVEGGWQSWISHCDGLPILSKATRPSDFYRELNKKQWLVEKRWLFLPEVPVINKCCCDFNDFFLISKVWITSIPWSCELISSLVLVTGTLNNSSIHLVMFCTSRLHYYKINIQSEDQTNFSSTHANVTGWFEVSVKSRFFCSDWTWIMSQWTFLVAGSI